MEITVIYPEVGEGEFTVVRGDTYTGDREITFTNVLSGYIYSGIPYLGFQDVSISGTIANYDTTFSISGALTADLREGMCEASVTIVNSEYTTTVFKGTLTLL